MLKCWPLYKLVGKLVSTSNKPTVLYTSNKSVACPRMSPCRAHAVLSGTCNLYLHVCCKHPSAHWHLYGALRYIHLCTVSTSLFDPLHSICSLVTKCSSKSVSSCPVSDFFPDFLTPNFTHGFSRSSLRLTANPAMSMGIFLGTKGAHMN